jgi:DNA-binding NarL/FixJ family response regulator
MEQITLILVDDHKLLTDSWADLINSDPRFFVLGAAGTAEDAYRIVEEKNPRIALVDIGMPQVDGFEITRTLKEISTETKVIGLSVHNNPAYVKKMMRAGATGYVTKNSSREELFTAIMEVDQGGKYICKEVKELLAMQLGLDTDLHLKDTLTTRELMIIDLLREGRTSREIALSAGITLKTVEVHRYNILKKLGLKNTASLIKFIHEQGM